MNGQFRRFLGAPSCRPEPLLVGLLLAAAAACPAAAERERFSIPRIDATIEVDAALDEPAWRQALRLPLAYETEPGENVPAPVATECYLFHSRSHLFYACHAFDPEPAAIRARLSDRDRSADTDDTVGISLDPGFSLDRSYVFDVNALGIQNDRLYTESERSSDFTWDVLWESAGRIVADGFVVEVAIPFSSLRFPASAQPQTWGFSFRRYMPRDVKRRISIHPDDRNNRCRTCQHAELVGFVGIDPGMNLEVTPTLTANQNATRDQSGNVRRGDPEADPGLTVRYGLTPNLSLGGAINPDFSQVEADGARLDINQQFALFFPERRPFFLEGSDLFDSPLPIVHSRSVADPDWGVKLAGKQGRSAIGAFVARDAITNLLLPGADRSDVTTIDGESTAAVLRYRRDFGARGSTAGLIVTDRGGRDYANRVAGADTRLRLSTADLLTVQLLGSTTHYPSRIESEFGGERAVDGAALRVQYEHDTRGWETGLVYSDVDQGFRADLGFLPQVDTRSLRIGGARKWHGGEDRWFNRLEAGGDLFRNERQDGEREVSGGDIELRYSGRRQTEVEIEISRRDRRYRGTDFPLTTASVFFAIRPSAAFDFGTWAALGDGIDFEGGRPGDQVVVESWLEWRVGRRLSTALSTIYSSLDLAEGRLFRALITDLRVRYQWSARTFLRAVVQRASIDRAAELYPTAAAASSEEIFGQLLFTYKIDPQTALYVGYSGDYAELAAGGRLERTGDTLFAKLSYAWRPSGRGPHA